MEKWVEIRKSGDFVKVGQECNISPITARVLRNRDVITPEEIEAYLHSETAPLTDPFLMKDIREAALFILNKISLGKKIRIIGDYDVDGICSTYILYRSFEFLGADADYRIPHRIEDGYGINDKMIDEAHEAGIDTIVTCDNGISASTQVQHARDLSMSIVVTDHHEIPFEIKNDEKVYILPDADVLLDPKREDDTYPFSGICGAMVAYKLVSVMQKLIENKEFVSDKLNAFTSEEFKKLDDILVQMAGLATVCDVMELKSENRTIVKRALKLMEKTENKGLKALIEVTGIKGRALSSYQFGFVIGPCLNASGRLDTSLKALELLLCENESLAYEKAQELKSLNEERKSMTQKALEEAEVIVDESLENDKVLVVYLPKCHESLAGIVAGRIREKFNKPSFVITDSENGAKGSGRSIDAYNMYEELTKVSDILTKFGGHKLAAGLSLPKERIDEFRKALNENTTLTKEDFVETVRFDMILPPEYVNVNLAKELSCLEPFGTGNSKPLMALGDITIISGTYLGKTKQFGKYKFSYNQKLYEMVYFGDVKSFEEYVRSVYGDDEADNLHSGVRVNIKLSIIYEIGLNEYMGTERAQIIMKYYI